MSQIGKIDCGFLAMYQGKVEDHWMNPQSNVDGLADVEAAKAVLENQDVRMEPITGKKKRIISVEWLKKCGVTTSSCSDDCNITGQDATPECKEYEIVCLRETSFKMPKREYRGRTREFEEVFFFNMLRHKRALDEWLDTYIITGLATNAGINAYPGIGTNAGNVTRIAANLWDDSIWSYFNLANRMNKIESPYLVTGTNLYQYIFNRQHESMTDVGKAGMAKIGSIRKVYQDPENIETLYPKRSFMVAKTAAAFINKAWNPVGAVNAVEEAGVYALWSEQSSNIPGVYYDVITQESCSGNEFYLGVKVQLHGVFAVNPTPCDKNNTGILAYQCV